MFLKKKQKNIVVKAFTSSNYNFEADEELPFKSSQFAPYDEVWCYLFKNKLGKCKYLILDDKEEINCYAKYFKKN